MDVKIGLFALSILVGCAPQFVDPVSKRASATDPKHNGYDITCHEKRGNCLTNEFALLRAPNNVVYTTRATVTHPAQDDEGAATDERRRAAIRKPYRDTKEDEQ